MTLSRIFDYLLASISLLVNFTYRDPLDRIFNTGHGGCAWRNSPSFKPKDGRQLTSEFGHKTAAYAVHFHLRLQHVSDLLGHSAMPLSAQTVLLFGDQSDAFVESIDYICKQAEHHSWLRSFLADTFAVLNDETRHWECALRRSLGSFHTIQELSDQFRHQGDVTGIAHGLLVFIMRQSLLLQSVIPSH